MKYKIILASGSPRRKEILESIGTRFQVMVSECEEKSEEKNPESLVEELSFQKASAVSLLVTEPAVILGADTVVFCAGKILGKPHSKEEAERMISMLSGKIHQVCTGVTVIIKEAIDKEERCITFHKTTDVSVYPMTDEQVKQYVALGESEDKAGGYAIQGRFSPFIQKISGDYLNIVGFPLAEVFQRLFAEGIDLVTGEK